MKHKHTPGPWMYSGVLIKSEKTLVAKVLDFKNESKDANGALIAAAPEMLEALEAAYLQLAMLCSTPIAANNSVAVLDAVFAAIIKAKGGAE